MVKRSGGGLQPPNHPPLIYTLDFSTGVKHMITISTGDNLETHITFLLYKFLSVYLTFDSTN